MGVLPPLRIYLERFFIFDIDEAYARIAYLEELFELDDALKAHCSSSTSNIDDFRDEYDDLLNKIDFYENQF